MNPNETVCPKANWGLRRFRLRTMIVARTDKSKELKI
jgi:hypothetical protein